MLPAFRMTKRSPGSRCVSSSGTTRLSEQVMKSVRGFWVLARLLNSSKRFGKASRRNFKNPSMISRMVDLLVRYCIKEGWCCALAPSTTLRVRERGVLSLLVEVAALIVPRELRADVLVAGALG